MKTFAILLCVGALSGCPPSSDANEKPAGTPTDPVQVCEQAGDVCQEQGSSQLGVCNKSTACTGPDACFKCAPQH